MANLRERGRIVSEIRCSCGKSFVAIDDKDTLLGPGMIISGFKKDLFDDSYKCIYCNRMITGYSLFSLERMREKKGANSENKSKF